MWDETVFTDWLKRPAGARWGPIRNMNHQLEMLPNTVTEQEEPRPLQWSLQSLRGRRNCLRDNNLCNTPTVRSLLWGKWERESGLKEPEPVWPHTEEKIQVSAQQWCKTRQTAPQWLGESLSVVENPWTLWAGVFRGLNVTVKYKRCSRSRLTALWRRICTNKTWTRSRKPYYLSLGEKVYKHFYLL